MPKPFEPKKADGSDMSIADQFRKHWLPSIIGLCCAVAAATWKVEYEVIVVPLRNQLEANDGQAERLSSGSEILLPSTWMTKGSSTSTRDGSCFIRVDDIDGFGTGQPLVTLSVTIGETITQFKNVPSATRRRVSTQDAMYSIDINEIDKEKGVGIGVT